MHFPPSPQVYPDPLLLYPPNFKFFLKKKKKNQNPNTTTKSPKVWKQNTTPKKKANKTELKQTTKL